MDDNVSQASQVSCVSGLTSLTKIASLASLGLETATVAVKQPTGGIFTPIKPFNPLANSSISHVCTAVPTPWIQSFVGYIIKLTDKRELLNI